MDKLNVIYYAPKLWPDVMIWLPRTTDNSTHFAQSLEIQAIESRHVVLIFVNQQLLFNFYSQKALINIRLLTLNAPIATKVVCFSRLLKL